MLGQVEFKDRYIANIIKFLETGFSEDILFEKIDQLWQLIETDYLADSLKMYDNNQVQVSLNSEVDQVPGLKPFISARIEHVRQQLTEITALSSNHLVNETAVPVKFTVGDNYPNPFNPVTTIDIDLTVAGEVIFTIHNLLGQVIEKRTWQNLTAGRYSIQFDARNLPSGTYLYSFRMGSEIISRKMLLLK
jgi:hypothetical protein